MNRRRVAVVGLGTVNPTGNNVNDSWNAIREGKCGIAKITAYDTTESAAKLAGEVKNFDPTDRIAKRETRHTARFTQIGLYAAIEAVEMSGIRCVDGDEPANTDPARCGVIISSGIGSIGTIEEEHTKGGEKGFDRVSPFFIPTAISNMAAARVAIRFGMKGMCTCPVTACAGGSNAIGDAFHRIRDGYEDVMVCGGAESCITPLAIGGFTSMKALCTLEDPERASIPFDADRAGFVMGEGAGILVLEEMEHAKARGAKILAEIVGYGANCDAYDITAPLPDGSGAADCMRLALEDAGMKPEEITYINAHGTSTKLNDAGETKAIHEVFGDYAAKLQVSSTKSMTGHLLGAAGGVEAVFSVKAIEDQFLPATIGYKTPDPVCDLDYIPNEGRNADVSAVLSDNLGFGGHNAAVIFRRV